MKTTYNNDMNNKVLICDDEYLIRQGIEFMIDWQKEGFEICGRAANGKQALELIETEKPDLVISDIVMPEMDGVELTKKIQEKWPEIQVIILSSYSEFDYVRNTLTSGAVDYILKPTLSPDVLKASLKKAMAHTPAKAEEAKPDPGQTLSRIIYGSDEPLPDLDSDWPLVFLVFDEDRKKQIMKTVTEDSLKVSCEIRMQQHLHGLLLEGDPDLSALRNRIEENEGGFVLADRIRQPEEFCNLFARRMDPFMKERFYTGEHCLVMDQEIPVSKSIPFSQAEYARLLNLSDYTEAFRLLQEWLELAGDNHTQQSEIKSVLSGAIYTFTNILEDSSLNGEQVRSFKLNCFALTQNSSTLEELKSNLQSMIEDFRIITENYQVEESRRQIQAIMDYIRKHMAEPMQLQDVADQFGFSYSYLSSLISRSTSETFSEYLNRIRIEQACKLLQSTNRSISDIALACGYTDSGYFSRIFRKLMGKSPRQYRNLTRC